jgi:hypothetical protein
MFPGRSNLAGEDVTMRKGLLVVASAMLAIAGIALMEMGERPIAAGAFALMAAIVLLLYRRLRRASSEVPWILHVAAAVGVTVGTITLLSGLVHVAAVTAVAVREGVWIPLTILRLTTGALLVFAGTMSIAMYRPMREGRRWATGVGAATSLLFCFYLILLFFLPGTRGTVPPMLGLWSAYLVWLAAAVVASVPGRPTTIHAPRTA